MTAFTLGYHTGIVNRQYSRRFPVHPDIPLSSTHTLASITCILLVVHLMYQCYRHRMSRHQFQFVSIYTALFTVSIPIVAVWLCYVVGSNDERAPGRYGIFFIDIYDFLWCASQAASVLKWTPQVRSVHIFVCLH